MGNCLASVFRRRTIRRHIVLILIGLDNAGKSRTVNNLAGEKDEEVLPTVGFKAVNLVHKDTPVTIYDLGGGPNFRQIWSQYYSEVHGVIFVIDSSDFSRLDECKEVLEAVLSHDKISGKPILVLANKQDKSDALDDIDVVEKLNIEPLVNRFRCPTLVESYSAIQVEQGKKPKIDPGLRKGYQWLLNYIVRRYGDINLRVQTDIHADLERRKRMLSKPKRENIDVDIETQTGFENPNYGVKSTENTEKVELELDPSVIVVKPVTNSINTTMTVESVDSSNTSAKPKLSPLFGRVNSTVETVKIELEGRNEFRKLSPIVRRDNHIDFQNRPQSSPAFKKRIIKTEDSSKTSSVVDDDSKGSDSNAPGNRTWDGPVEVKHRVLINNVDMNNGQRDDVVAERDNNKTASSEVTLQAATLPSLPLSARPASASALVRRQLELSAQHKRRLSLRYMHRHKTSPERTSMLVYSPKGPPRLDKGDFEQAPTVN